MTNSEVPEDPTASPSKPPEDDLATLVREIRKYLGYELECRATARATKDLVYRMDEMRRADFYAGCAKALELRLAVLRAANDMLRDH